MIELEEHYVPQEIPEPDADAFDEYNDPHGTRRTIYVERLSTMREKAIYEMESNRTSLYAVIWGQLSSESEEAVKQAEDWDEIEQSKDPLRLYLRILVTHRTSNTGSGVMDRRNARNAYNSLQQRPDETITDFKKRFDHALEVYRACDQQAPPDEDLAADFIGKLDNARYGTMKASLDNFQMLGFGDYPSTLVDAFSKSSKYKVTSTRQMSSSTPSGAAFITHGRGKDGESKKNAIKGTPRDAPSKPTQKNEHKQAKPVGTKKVYTCNLCGELGHFMKDCTWLTECKAVIEERKPGGRSATTALHLSNAADYYSPDQGSVVLVNKINETGLKPFDVLLDNQATTSIIKEARLLSNIREASTVTHINGIGGVLDVHLEGDMEHFGVVNYSDQALANVLSFSATRADYEIVYDKLVDKFSVIISPTTSLHFVNRGGLYVCNMSRLASRIGVAAVTTVDDNMSKYSKREIAGAENARELMRQLGYPSSRDLMDLIKSGGIINSNVTAQDVYRASQIFGADLASLKGKTVTTKPEPAKIEYIPKPTQEELTLHTDIMFVERDPYLVSVSTPLGLTMCTHLGGKRTESTITKALREQIAAYTAERFVVRTVLSDGEGAILSSSTMLKEKGISFNPSGPGQHVPVIENKIRRIKERVRAHLSVLPFHVPIVLMKWLVSFCVSRINCIPTATAMSKVSPREIFLGRKLDKSRDIRLGFGDYVQCTTPNVIKNSMTPRTEGAIALLPVGNLQGSVKFFSLTTSKVVVRDKWTVLPMPRQVVDFLNAMAKSTQRVRDEPLFSIGNAEVIDVDEPAASSSCIYDTEPMRVITNSHVADRDSSTSVYYDEPAAEYDVVAADDPINSTDSDPMPEVVSELRGDDADTDGADTGADTEAEHAGANEDTSDPTSLSSLPSSTVSSLPSSTVSSPMSLTGSELPSPTLDEPPAAPVASPTSRYNLRSNRSYGHRDGHWRTRKEHYGLHITAKKAIGTYGKQAVSVMLEELKQMLDKGVWEPVAASTLTFEQRKAIIRSSIFLKEKFTSAGVFDKLKARLVAGGNMQDRSLYDDVSSPTVTTTSVMIVAALAAKERRHVITADIGGAYLNAEMKNSVVHMRLDATLSGMLVQLDHHYSSFLLSDGTLVVKLKKALYGCVESAKLWHEHISSTLKSIGFIANPQDRCVFNQSHGGVQCTICVYVDDLFITCCDRSQADVAVAKLIKIYKEVKVTRGLTHSYIGMTFNFSVPLKVTVTMEGYIKDVIKLYDVRRSVVTPALDHLFEIRESPLLERTKAEEFHSRVAKLMYLAKRVRPDLLTACAFLSTRAQSPTEDDWAKLQRGLEYLYGTQELGITLECDNGPVNVKTHVDAAYGVHHDAKSHSGVSSTLGKGPIYVKSSKQKLVTKSSTEAEQVSLSDNSSQVIWTREFLISQGYRLDPSIIYQDNQSTIAMVNKGYSTSERTRHIKIRYFFIKDLIDKKELKLEYLPTGEMLADMLTKPLQGELFRRMRKELMNY